MVLDERMLLLCTSGATPGKNESTKQFLARVTHFNLQQRRLHSLEGVDACSGIKYLYAYGNLIQEFPSGLQRCRSLQGLYLSYNALESLDGVQQAAGLQVLLVDHNAIQVVSNHLTGCSELRELSLAYQRLPADVPLYFEPAVLSGLSHCLLSLDVSGCGLRSLKPFAALTSLKRFVATDNHVESVDDAAALVSRLPQLEELDVRRNLLTQTAGPGGSYRAVLLRACISSALHTLDGKPVSMEHLMFINALSTRRAGPDGGGTVGSSLLPLKGGTRVWGKQSHTPRQIGTRSTGREPGSVGQSFLGPSPATGSIRSSPGYVSMDGYEGVDGSDTDDLISLGDTRRSGRIVPVSVMKSHAKAAHGVASDAGALAWPSQARGGAVLAGRQVHEYDPLAAAAAYAAQKAGSGGQPPNAGPAADAMGSRGTAETPGSQPSTASMHGTKRALSFMSPSQQGANPQHASAPDAAGTGGQRDKGRFRDSDGGSVDDLDLSDAEERAPEDTPGAPSRGAAAGGGPAGRTGAVGHIFGSPMDTTLPRGGAGLTPSGGPSAWKGPRQQPSFLDTHITEEPEGEGEGVDGMGDASLDQSMRSGSMTYSAGEEDQSSARPVSILDMLQSRGRISSRGASGPASGPGSGPGVAAAAPGRDVDVEGSHSSFTASTDFGSTIRSRGGAAGTNSSGGGSRGSSSGRPPLPPSAGTTSGQQQLLPLKPPVRMIEVPRGNGKPPLLLPVPESGLDRVGSASGFRSHLSHNPRPDEYVEPPRRTPHDFMRGSRFRDSEYATPEDRRRAARAAAEQLLRRGGTHKRDGWDDAGSNGEQHSAWAEHVPQHLVGGLEGPAPAARGQKARRGPKPVGTIVGGPADDFLVGGVLANYMSKPSGTPAQPSVPVPTTRKLLAPLQKR